MGKWQFILFMLLAQVVTKAQNPADTVAKAPGRANADDPSQFFTRIELYNELQHYRKNDIYLNQTILRTIVKIGKKFTTRVDLPYVHNSFQSPAKYDQSGLGDISFRLLGYKILETQRSAIAASMEISLNTASSPLLGTGKNLLIPVISYTHAMPKIKMLFSMVLQQTNSVSGDENRPDISFTKFQFLTIKYFSRRTWLVVGPEWFIDYLHGGLSMNLRTRFVYAVTPRMNAWITPSAGIFGDFAGRYQWSADAGIRYFLLREMNFKKTGTSLK